MVLRTRKNRQFNTFADDCLGHRLVNHIYRHFEIPLKLRCQAKLALVFHVNEDPLVAARLHEHHFHELGVDRKIVGDIYAANKAIMYAVSLLQRREPIIVPAKFGNSDTLPAVCRN